MTQEYKSSLPRESRPHNEELQVEMEKQDIDMLILPTPEDIYYSTGYRSWYISSFFRPVHVLVSRRGDPAIILRILEKTTVQYTSWTSRIYCWGIASRSLGPLKGGEPISTIDKIMEGIQPGAGTIGLEAGDGTQYFWPIEPLKKIMDSQLDTHFTSGSLAVQRTGMMKTPWEIGRIHHVHRTTEQAISEAGETIVTGETTEKDIFKGVATRMARGGVDKIPHLTTTSDIDKYCTFNTYAIDRVVQKGEYVLVGISGRVDGYAPDLTRVFHLGTVPREERETTTTASGCVATVKGAAKPGVSIAEINHICEEYIRDSGFGKFPLHSSGHCIGLDMMECPTVHDEVSEKLKPGTVSAVEDGVYPYDLEEGVESIYLPSQMEDEMLVTEDDAEWITGLGESAVEVGANY